MSLNYLSKLLLALQTVQLYIFLILIEWDLGQGDVGGVRFNPVCNNLIKCDLLALQRFCGSIVHSLILIERRLAEGMLGGSIVPL